MQLNSVYCVFVLTTNQKGSVRPLPAYMLSLRDPADETNDLGRKGIAIKHVQATFRHLRRRLDFDVKVNTRPSILSPLVGSCYMLNQSRREKLESYGKHLVYQMENSLAAKAKALRDAEAQWEDRREGSKEVKVEQEGQK